VNNIASLKATQRKLLYLATLRASADSNNTTMYPTTYNATATGLHTADNKPLPNS
jgi:hypothetical protein